jgi:hypothetical protein
MYRRYGYRTITVELGHAGWPVGMHVFAPTERNVHDGEHIESRISSQRWPIGPRQERLRTM